MRNTCLSLLAATALFSGVAHATEPTNAAQNRAALYQQEVRAALTKRDWSITQDGAGKLIAERRRVSQDGTNEFIVGSDNEYTHLEINFQADGKNHTASSARASLYIYEQRSSYHAGFMAYPPIALRDPKLTREYLDVLAEAESRLAAGHHAYAAAGVGGSQNDHVSDKVAMK